MSTDGISIRISHDHPTVGDVVFQSDVIIGDPSSQFQYSSFFAVDVTEENLIVFDGNASGSFNPGEFNGITIIDYGDALPDFTGLTLEVDGAGGPVDGSRYWFDANNIYLNFQGLGINSLDGITFHFTLGAAPTLINLTSTQVREEFAGAVVGELHTTDGDQVDGHDYIVDDARFEVVNDQLRLKAGITLDADAEPLINLTVTSTDEWGNSFSQTFDISVNAYTPPSPPGPTVSTGSNGSNWLPGTEGEDRIHGKGGDDTIFARGGDDTVHGDNGNDTMGGGAGNDRMYGGQGDDLMYGGAGNDRLFGDAGEDMVWAGIGNDSVDGGAGNDTIGGGAGSDTLIGGEGNDVIYGGAGTDLIYGDAGDDTLFGGVGSDTLWGGEGDDLLYGGGGIDTFGFAGASGNDTIRGYEAGVDQIDIGDQTYEIAESDSGFALITLSGGGTILLTGIDVADVSSDWFV